MSQEGPGGAALLSSPELPSQEPRRLLINQGNRGNKGTEGAGLRGTSLTGTVKEGQGRAWTQDRGFLFHKETAGCPPKKQNLVEEFGFGALILLLNCCLTATYPALNCYLTYWVPRAGSLSSLSCSFHIFKMVIISTL